MTDLVKFSDIGMVRKVSWFAFHQWYSTFASLSVKRMTELFL